MLITPIQSIVSAFDENFGPLEKRGGEETGKSADQDLLEKRRLHAVFGSTGSARQVAFLMKMSILFSLTSRLPGAP